MADAWITMPSDSTVNLDDIIDRDSRFKAVAEAPLRVLEAKR